MDQVKICAICGGKISSDDRFFLGVDRPHFSVYLHKSCFNTNKNTLDVLKLYDFYLENERKSLKKR